MSGIQVGNGVTSDVARLRDDWLARVGQLVSQVETWGGQLDWATRRIEKRLQDSEIGSYVAPALLLQKETARLILEPIARSAPGAEGVVDLYLMPAYDDIATLFFVAGEWRMHFRFAGSATPESLTGAAQPLTLELLQRVFDEMLKNAV